MIIVDRCNQLISYAEKTLPYVPEQNRTIGSTRGKQTLMDRMPRYRTGFLFVTAEDLDLFAQISQIEQLQ